MCVYLPHMLELHALTTVLFIKTVLGRACKGPLWCHIPHLVPIEPNQDKGHIVETYFNINSQIISESYMTQAKFMKFSMTFHSKGSFRAGYASLIAGNPPANILSSSQHTAISLYGKKA